MFRVSYKFSVGVASVAMRSASSIPIRDFLVGREKNYLKKLNFLPYRKFTALSGVWSKCVLTGLGGLSLDA